MSNMSNTNIDIRKIAEQILAQLDTDHTARREGVILLHNAIMAEVARLNPQPTAEQPGVVTDVTPAAE